VITYEDIKREWLALNKSITEDRGVTDALEQRGVVAEDFAHASRQIGEGIVRGGHGRGVGMSAPQAHASTLACGVLLGLKLARKAQEPPSAPPPDWRVALTEGETTNFDTLKQAAENDDLALVRSAWQATQEPCALVCAVTTYEDNSVELTPFAVLIDGDPYELFEAPMSERASDNGGAS
jgi:hypothetical protein